MPTPALDPFLARARTALAGGEPLARVLDEAQARAAHSPALGDLVPALCQLVGATVRGDYEHADDDEVELALAAVLYVASPWDQTPDYLPDGLRDDEVVTRAVAGRLERALREFEAWRNPPERRPRRRT